jgi:virginiamycin B lyase
MWFTETQGNRISCIDKQGHIQEFEVPTPDSSRTGIRNGPDGNIWLTEESAGRIGRLNLVN